MEDYDPNNSPVTGIYLSNYLNWSTVANYNLILKSTLSKEQKYPDLVLILSILVIIFTILGMTYLDI